MDRSYPTLLEFYRMAPEVIPNFRTERYRGDLMSVPLHGFNAEDRAIVLQVYNSLGELYFQLQSQADHAHHYDSIKRWDYSQVASCIQKLGNSTVPLDTRLARIVHDIRGGALTTLLMKLALFELKPLKSGDIQSVYFYLRDHRKMMRNCVEGLDPEAEQRDSSARPHSIELLKEKWLGQTHLIKAGRPALICLESDYSGSIAERCLEFSALDRVIYNLINNAARFTADGSVRFVILPIPQENSENLRFIISNRITGEQEQALRTRFGDQVSNVFLGGFTTDSTGQGMNICAEFVRNAYGLRNVKDAIQGGYIGVKIHNDFWSAWFHWPILKG